MRTVSANADEFSERLIIHAPNVHCGGGAVLLNALLQEHGVAKHVILFADQRMQIDPVLKKQISVRRYQPTLLNRLYAERDLRSLAHPSDTVLFLGNLPPLFNVSGNLVLFLQNRLLVDPSVKTQVFPKRVRARLMLEKLWLRLRVDGVRHILVQSDSMAEKVCQTLGREAQVTPFVLDASEQRLEIAHELPTEKEFDFVYVSSGDPHKNHQRLFEAWGKLGREGIAPRLAVTLAPNSDKGLMTKIESLNAECGTKIKNLGVLGPSEVESLYRKSAALIFPSEVESFGLPLLEANQFGLPILASERDYVRDVVDPVQTFDPQSPKSIARAVQRHLGAPEKRRDILSAREFLRVVICRST